MNAQPRKFDPYAELDVPQDASADEVKRAFRDRAKHVHPDAGGDREDFERAQRAQVILLDPARRRRYDQTGDADDPAINGPDHGALTMISSLLTQILAEDNADPLKHDLVAVMVRSLRADDQKAAEGVAKAERSLERIAKMKRRFRCRDGAPSPIEKMLDFNEGMLRQMIAQQAEAKAARARAVEILEQHDFEQDKEETSGSFLTKMMMNGASTI